MLAAAQLRELLLVTAKNTRDDLQILSAFGERLGDLEDLGFTDADLEDVRRALARCAGRCNELERLASGHCLKAKASES